MDQQTLGRTRRALHGVAELVLAGPQYTESREIRLRVTPGGFGTVTTPDLRVAGLELVSTTGRVPLAGRAALTSRHPSREILETRPAFRVLRRLPVRGCLLWSHDLRLT
jgi:hypothetical protein